MNIEPIESFNSSLLLSYSTVIYDEMEEWDRFYCGWIFVSLGFNVELIFYQSSGWAGPWADSFATNAKKQNRPKQFFTEILIALSSVSWSKQDLSTSILPVKS